jgi:hypothetical protein
VVIARNRRVKIQFLPFTLNAVTAPIRANPSRSVFNIVDADSVRINPSASLTQCLNRLRS